MINDILIGIAWFGVFLACCVGGYCTGVYLRMIRKQNSSTGSGNRPIQDKK